jgi:hypothetical protein
VEFKAAANFGDGSMRYGELMALFLDQVVMSTTRPREDLGRLPLDGLRDSVGAEAASRRRMPMTARARAASKILQADLRYLEGGET